MDTYTEVYSEIEANKIATEFSRLKGEYYLEHVGATLYSDKQIENVFKDLESNLFGNPHAHNISSKLAEDGVDQIRYRVLEHFNTNPEEYSIIFTSGATAALKIVAETFDYSNNGASKNGLFMYIEDNHTSVLGMREYADNIKILTHEDAFNIFNKNYLTNENKTSVSGNSLFVYSAQCNFTGTKYPLKWIEYIHNGVLNTNNNKLKSKWFCMLDAASYVSSNKLDLNIFKPDFVCISFYKIFGYPTGLGALLVKNSSSYVLKKRYFGGGTVQMALHSEHVFRPTLHERFEDGTLPFLSIISLRHGFDTLKRLSFNMEKISAHVFSLAKYVHHSLLLMHHNNGCPVAILYHDTDFENKDYQGGIVNFNLIRDNGQYIGYSEVLHIANLYRIHLRTGCFCNPGACRRHLKLTSADVKQQFNAGHVCGDQNDLIDGYPTGSIRISFGYMSTKQDADKLLEMIEDCFVSKPVIKKIPEHWSTFQLQCKDKFCDKSKVFKTNNNVELNISNNYMKINNITHILNQTKITKNLTGSLRHIFVYPIKSCGPYSVTDSWQIEPTGLSYDREWMIVNSAGICLTQKHEPRMCLIMPVIKLKEEVLELHFPDMPAVTVPLAGSPVFSKTRVTLCQSKICGDRVNCIDCGDEIADWLCEALQRSDLRLFRQDTTHQRTNRKDGTLPFLSIISLRHGFDTLKRLSFNMEKISAHVFSLAKYVHHSLLLMHHNNGCPVAILYHDTDFENKDYQGGIVNFNLIRDNGQYIGYSEVLHIANLYRIHLRTGCFCNPGACRRHLKLTSADVKQQFNAGHVCGDQNDLIDGYPTGSIRISFGYMSTKQDADKLLEMIEDCFVSKPVIKKIPEHWSTFQLQCKDKFCDKSKVFKTNNNVELNISNNYMKINNITHILNQTKIKKNLTGSLRHIFVYPIKSCGPYSVTDSWQIEPTGLSYDREWMIVNSAGICLTQKHEPRMCLIMPVIKLKEQVLELHFPDMPAVTVPLAGSPVFSKTRVTLCQSKICGDRVNCIDCGDEIADWLCEALQRSDLRLFRQDTTHQRTNRKGEKSNLSLVNQAQFLFLNIASVKYLANSIEDFRSTDDGLQNLIYRFRANLVVELSEHFVENFCDKVAIGNNIFKCIGPCTRCQMICIDQTTGEKSIEPLRTLSILTESKIRFGVYLSHTSTYTTQISLKDEVILE